MSNKLYDVIIHYFRSEAIGYVQITSRIGAAASPWMAEWLRFAHWRAPFILMGVLAIVSAALMELLPETKHLKTPEFLDTDVRASSEKIEVGRNSRKRNGQKLSLVQEEEMENGEV